MSGSVSVEQHRQLRRALTVESVLCLATLVALGVLSVEATVSDSSRFYMDLPSKSCDTCPHKERCLAFAING